jgi:acyl-CoA synthetase (NDP forming)
MRIRIACLLGHHREVGLLRAAFRTTEACRATASFPALPGRSNVPVDVSATVSLSVAESTAFLEQWQVPMAPSILCAHPIDIAAAASTLGFPVALKVSSRAVPRKSEVGGLRLGLANPEALTLAADEMIKTM